MITLCLSNLKCFETFRNCSLFCTFWLLRSFYSDDAHHGDYDERCSNHHFRSWAQIVYHIYSVLKIIEIALWFAHFGFTKFLLRWCAPCWLWWTLFKTSFQTLRTLFISRLQCFATFRNCCLFCTFWLLRSFYSDDAHHGDYDERCSNHHFRSWAQIVYHIYSVLKIIEVTVCFAHFGIYEISTPVLRTILTMVNVVQIILSDIAHSVYITFTVFWNFSKLLFVLHILAFTKFLLRWCAPWWLWWTFFKSSFPKLSTHCISHLERFESYRNYSLFCTFWHWRNLYSGATHHANYGERSSNHHFRHWSHSVYQI